MTGRGLHGDCLRQRDWHEKQPEHDRRTRGARGVNAALGLRGDAGGDAGEGSSGQAHRQRGHGASTRHVRARDGHRTPMSNYIPSFTDTGAQRGAWPRADECRGEDGGCSGFATRQPSGAEPEPASEREGGRLQGWNRSHRGAAGKRGENGLPGGAGEAGRSQNAPRTPALTPGLSKGRQPWQLPPPHTPARSLTLTLTLGWPPAAGLRHRPRGPTCCPWGNSAGRLPVAGTRSGGPTRQPYVTGPLRCHRRCSHFPGTLCWRDLQPS